VAQAFQHDPLIGFYPDKSPVEISFHDRSLEADYFQGFDLSLIYPSSLLNSRLVGNQLQFGGRISFHSDVTATTVEWLWEPDIVGNDNVSQILVNDTPGSEFKYTALYGWRKSGVVYHELVAPSLPSGRTAVRFR
jgi:hypothetical protein